MRKKVFIIGPVGIGAALRNGARKHGEYLNEWELGFVDSLMRSRYRQLTEKQADCLERIQQKILHRSEHSNGDASPF